MNITEFMNILSRVENATSVTGRRYHSIQLVGDSLKFTRENKKRPEYISVIELFELFSKEEDINTSVAKSYISGRVQSPAVAVLKVLKSL